MSKMPVEWYKRCLQNSRKFESSLLSDANAIYALYESTKAKNDITEAQIKRAEAEGKDSFDEKRYKV